MWLQLDKMLLKFQIVILRYYISDRGQFLLSNKKVELIIKMVLMDCMTSEYRCYRTDIYPIIKVV